MQRIAIIDIIQYKTSLTYFTAFFLLHITYVFNCSFEALSDNLQFNQSLIFKKKTLSQKSKLLTGGVHILFK